MRVMTCICCPVGCRLEVDDTDPNGVLVSGNRCPRGDVYGREEILNPQRTVTAVVRTASPKLPCVPVRTDRPLSRRLIAPLLGELYRLELKTPLPGGSTILTDYAGSGVNVILTRDLIF